MKYANLLHTVTPKLNPKMKQRSESENVGYLSILVSIRILLFSLWRSKIVLGQKSGNLTTQNPKKARKQSLLKLVTLYVDPS